MATIIGVAPDGFVGVDDNDPPALFIPITTYRGARDAASADPASWFTTYSTGWVSIMVRRKPSENISGVNEHIHHAPACAGTWCRQTHRSGTGVFNDRCDAAARTSRARDVVLSLQETGGEAAALDGDVGRVELAALPDYVLMLPEAGSRSRLRCIQLRKQKQRRSRRYRPSRTSWWASKKSSNASIRWST